MTDANSVFLPAHTKPSKYNLTLTPDLVQFTFAASEVIELEVLSATTSITVHAIDLTVTTSYFQGADGARKETQSVNADSHRQTVTFEFGSQLPLGAGQLFIDFTGPISKQLCGFYRSAYTVNGETRYLGCTQFEAADARRALFCWDEPAVKARFQMTIVHPADRVAISNMPIVKTESLPNNLRRTLFDVTPIMSTYLLAFVIGEFDFLSAFTPEGIEVRVYAPPGKVEQGHFSLNVAVKALSFYAKHFGSAYPLPKVDLIAIPDFAAGAMENWGCVTYRETALLVDDANTSVDMKQRVARTVSHELAHMWFGNLVTMQWWTDLWLNEGFARYTEHLAVDHIFPQWDIWAQFGTTVYNRALQLDSLSNSHPIQVDVNHPDEINEIFDTISYSKGSSLIRMLADWLGVEVFDRCLVTYLSRYAYQNAKTEQLWQVLEEGSGKNVSETMHGWTKITGYPYLTVEELPSPAAGQRQFRLTQHRFLASGQKCEEDPIWFIPVRRVTESGNADFSFMQERQTTVTVNAGPNEWVKFNAGQTGFYRVLYPESMLKELQRAVSSGQLSAADRLGLQNDAFELCKAGFMPLNVYLSLLDSYIGEQDQNGWADIAGNLAFTCRVFAEQPAFPKMRAFLQKLFASISSSLGLFEARPGEPEQTGLLRSSILLILGKYAKQQDVIDWARAQLARGWQSISADVRYPVYAVVLSNASEDDRSAYDTIKQIFSETTFPEEQRRIMRALGNATSAELLKETLVWGNSDKIRDQDRFFPFAAVSANPKGSQLAWDFFKSHFAEFEQRYAKGQSFLIGYMISGICDNFSTEAAADDIQTFFATNKLPMADRTIKQSVEQVRCSANFLGRSAASFSQFFA
eukprot:GILI01010185.1.p2 GENE.GILI01010185.1~~GILI01010185.1.p2  ORF type:complete len:863 (+),score=319.04 GILI01010185.1:50-2638(+)